jgi:hypothetical protein
MDLDKPPSGFRLGRYWRCQLPDGPLSWPPGSSDSRATPQEAPINMDFMMIRPLLQTWGKDREEGGSRILFAVAEFFLLLPAAGTNQQFASSGGVDQRKKITFSAPG